MRPMTRALVTVFLCCFLDGCGSRVSGHTYHNNGGVVQVEFRPSGRAFVSAGLVSHTCSYSESGKTVSLMCDENTTSFTMQDDGVLVGPPDGPMARLTPVLN